MHDRLIGIWHTSKYVDICICMCYQLPFISELLNYINIYNRKNLYIEDYISGYGL